MADELLCPRDRAPLVEAGQTHRCETCDGAWIHEDVLLAMLEQRTSKVWGGLVWEPRPADKARPCAACGKAMQMVNLGNVELDRCADHGVWFDADELAALLRQSRRLKTDPGIPADAPAEEHAGLLARISKLFKSR